MPAAVAGDICAVSKIEDIGFDAILHSSHDDDEVRMRPVAIPAPMYGVALELTQRGQEKKLSDALHKMTAEDPSLQIEFNAQANETVLRGMGELHLRVVMQRMKDEFGIDISNPAAENRLPGNGVAPGRGAPPPQENRRAARGNSARSS